MAVFKFFVAMAAKEAMGMAAEIAKEKTYQKMEQKRGQNKQVTPEDMSAPRNATEHDIPPTFTQEPPVTRERTTIYVTYDRNGNKRILDDAGQPVRVVRVVPR